MNRQILFAFCLAMALLGFGQTQAPATKPSTAAQESEDGPTREQLSDANIQLLREDIRSERKKIIAANLPLTEAEAVKFWPVYDRYVGETAKVNDSRYAIIKEYAQTHKTMTDAQADSLIKRWLALDADDAKLKQKYIPEFEKVISGKKTAMLFQMDRRLGMMIELQLASGVPLVKP